MFGTVAFASAPYAAAGGNVYQAVVSELVQAADVLSAQANFAVSFSDSAMGADGTFTSHVVLASFTDAAGAADAASSSYQIQSAVSELTTAAATPTALVTFGASASDTATATDTNTSVPTYATQVTETVNALDSAPSATPVYAATLADSAQAADATSSIFVFPCVYDETVTASTAQSAQAQFPTVVYESALGTGVNYSAATFNVALADNAQAIQNATAIVAAVAFIATISENVAAIDATLAQFLWNDIDDDQNAEWTDILQPRIVYDVATFGSFNFGVTSFAGSFDTPFNPLPATWSEIDNSQIPDWIDIDAV